MKTLRKKIEVMEAAERFAELQTADAGRDNWEDWGGSEPPTFNWEHVDYRVKPITERVPFTRADMTDEVRWVKHQNVVSLIQSIGYDSIVIGGGVGIVHGYEWLVNQGYEWSSSINGPWHPFTKEAK